MGNEIDIQFAYFLGNIFLLVIMFRVIVFIGTGIDKRICAAYQRWLKRQYDKEYEERMDKLAEKYQRKKQNEEYEYELWKIEMKR